MRRFLKFHPMALFCFFISVAIITMTGQNPIIILVSLFSAVAIAFLFMGAKSAFEGARFYILLLLAVMIINPVFSHNGKTVLFTILDIDFTKETILYGFFQGVMILAVIFWFRVFSFIFTTDKLLLLFGKYFPKLVLTLSMALRFIPLFKRQIIKISEIQKTMGKSVKNKKRLKIKTSLKVFESVLAWAPENALDTYDAMIARGYNGKRMTSAENYKFAFADYVFIMFIFGVAGSYIHGFINSSGFSFYNSDKILNAIDFQRLSLVIILFIYPAFLYIKENIIWKYSISKI